MKDTGCSADHLPAASIVERATPQLGKRSNVHGAERLTAKPLAGSSPQLASDARAAIPWKHVNDIDLDLGGYIVASRWTSTDEADYASFHICHEIHSSWLRLASLQPSHPLCGAGWQVWRRPARC
jgi:hypothetical protein